MDRDFKELARQLKDLCGRAPVYYLPNEGNWGDALIRSGTLQFLRDEKIDAQELPLKGRLAWLRPRLRPGTLLYGGGGGWCSLYDHPLTRLRQCQGLFRQIIVLPSTYETHYDLPNTIFFCRDRYQSLEAMPGARFCHDLAFYLGRRVVGEGKGSGSFFRTDSESLGRIPIPEGNCDLSLGGSHLTDPGPFFERIARHAVIHTDRLHVGIAACLLGRELHLYPGRYFKNKAVFQSSMEGRFEGVHFHETDFQP